MTIQLFMFLFTIGSLVSSLMTEAIKKSFESVSTNIIALADSILIGGIGTVFAYILIGIPFTLANVICIILMAVCIWIGSMVGYDKVMQTILQIKG